MTGLVANAQATLARALWLLTRVRGVALAGEALGFGDLIGGHLICNCLASSDRILSVLTG